MKPLLAATTTLLATFLITGCTTTGPSSRERPGASYSSVINTLYEQRATNAPTKKLSPPFRLAIAQIGETAPPETLRASLEKERYLFSQVSSLPLWVEHSGNGAPQIDPLRRLARDLGAEYLLIIGGNIDTQETSNFLSILDLTLIGGAIFPSKDISAEGRASGLLVDVESGQVMMQVSADLKRSSITPTFFSGDRTTTLNHELRDKLLTKLGDEFVRQLRERPAMASANRR